MAFYSDMMNRDGGAHIGHYVSGAAHVGLIGWLLVGPLFEVEPLPFDVTTVTTISEADYAALTGAEVPSDIAPEVPDAPAEPLTPEAPDVAPPAPVEETPPPAPPEPQEVTPAPLPEDLPEIPEPPAPVSEPDDTPPPEPAPPAEEDVAVVLPEQSPTPAPREAPRVAPEPVAPPEPDVQIDDTPREAVVPEETETPAETTEEQEAAQPEEATDQIVTEADEPASGAPERSVRPRGRPQVAPTVAEPADPVETPAPEAPAAPEVDTADAVADALAEALGGTSDPAPSAPSGPPLTSGERDALRVAVQQCWIVDVGSAASRVTVVVAMQMEETGRVIGNSIRMAGSEGGDATAAQKAFEAARRAILRCQKDGYDLPADKYDQWREIEMTFNPENVGR